MPSSSPGRDGIPPSASAGVQVPVNAPPNYGILPVNSPDPEQQAQQQQQPRNNAATAASAASVRALTSQAIAFYFRAPVKAFFRTRVDYLAYARGVHQARTEVLARALADDHTASRLGLRLRQAWLLLRSTTPGVLASAVKQHGWAVIPHQVLPPLVANVGVGAVLYTSYLQILGRLHPDSGRLGAARAYPPPSPVDTFTAGFLAGALQSVVAAPLDAIQARYDHRDLVPPDARPGAPPRSMWTFGAEKLREIGVRGVFAGWGLSFLKDGAGNALFFSVFEFVKAQGYYQYVTWYYGGLAEDIVDLLARKRPTHRRRAEEAGMMDDEQAEKSDKTTGRHRDRTRPTVIRPHYAIEPAFLLLAGIGASFAQQILLHPLTHIQVKHWDRLEDLDAKADKLRALAANPKPPVMDPTNPANPTNPTATAQQQQQQQWWRWRRWRMLRAYYRAYEETFAQLAGEARAERLGLARWLYRGFWWNAIRQVPSTSAGLIIFEVVRRKYGLGGEEVKITKDGYDILLH